MHLMASVWRYQYQGKNGTLSDKEWDKLNNKQFR